MKKEHILILSCIIMNSAYVAIAQEEYISEFGVTEGKPVDKGVVFIDGECLSAPYAVSRRGMSLYINDREIRNPKRHMETPVLTGDINLSQLSQQERQKLFRSLEATRGIYEKYLNRDYGYLFSSKGGHVRLQPYTVAYKLSSIINILESNLSRDEKLNKLRLFNWHLHIDIEPFVDNFSPSSWLTNKLLNLSEELLRVNEFRTGLSVSVDKGFVFLNGRYIESPYILQRRGLGFFLNGVLINTPPERPKQTPSGDVDVELPDDFNEEASWYDEEVQEYLSEKFAYLTKNSEKEKISYLMEQAINALPFVTEMSYNKKLSSVIHISTTEGLKIPCALIGFSTMRIREGQDPKESIDRDIQHFEKMLNRGVCYILSGTTGRTMLSSVNLSKKLPRLIEVLNSNEPLATKRNEIKNISDAITDRAIEQLVNNYSGSSQLKTRIEKLKNHDRL